MIEEPIELRCSSCDRHAITPWLDEPIAALLAWLTVRGWLVVHAAGAVRVYCPGCAYWHELHHALDVACDRAILAALEGAGS